MTHTDNGGHQIISRSPFREQVVEATKSINSERLLTDAGIATGKWLGLDDL